MAEVVFDDILEKIFFRLAVRDIIQCKSVCKSWYSVISSSRFVDFHLKHNNAVGRTRIIIKEDPKNILVGSSNGLVCIYNSDHTKLCVLNPCTRERKFVKHPYFRNYHFDFKPNLYGFGYDSSSDDYKVILGRYAENVTHFYLLSLKSNDHGTKSCKGMLRCVLGIKSAGILCNGALHWLMCDQNHNTVILSFHLSKGEFKEIPTPAHDKRDTWQTRLGIIEECLLFSYYKHDHPKWVMKNYNDKQSWELLSPLLQWDEDIIQDVKVLELESYNKAKSFFHYNLSFSQTFNYISAPVFVQSLVSPHFHFNKKQKRKRKRIFMPGGDGEK
uniref:F-box/kelch-repeat protein At3g23880-like isoform X2 n=1 Tax=Erigeron canadensis TaxID=72917 RepID=UPI001CB8FFE5|nr:F-box/kelch-repeat protein At3g23880-like isoform X2 [Erigeron canadensis]